MVKILRSILTLACISGLSYSIHATPIPLTIGDAQYLGSIDDGIPASEALEVEYINYLVTLTAGQGNTQIPAGTGEIYNRVGSTLSGPFPTAVIDNSLKVESEAPLIDAAGYNYILGKYGSGQSGGGSLVWYIGGNGAAGQVELPATYGGKELSHKSLYNLNPTKPVPDGGSAVVLLGIGLMSLGFVNRRKS